MRVQTESTLAVVEGTGPKPGNWRNQEGQVRRGVGNGLKEAGVEGLRLIPRLSLYGWAGFL